MTDMILAYVPESKHLTYAEAQALALKRDRQAADAFKASVPDGVFPYTYDDVLHERLADAERAASKPVLVTRIPEGNKPLRKRVERNGWGDWTKA